MYDARLRDCGSSHMAATVAAAALMMMMLIMSNWKGNGRLLNVGENLLRDKAFGDWISNL